MSVLCRTMTRAYIYEIGTNSRYRRWGCCLGNILGVNLNYWLNHCLFYIFTTLTYQLYQYRKGLHAYVLEMPRCISIQKGTAYIRFRNAEALSRLNGLLFSHTNDIMHIEQTRMVNLIAGECMKYEEQTRMVNSRHLLLKACTRLHLERLDV